MHNNASTDKIIHEADGSRWAADMHLMVNDDYNGDYPVIPTTHINISTDKKFSRHDTKRSKKQLMERFYIINQ